MDNNESNPKPKATGGLKIMTIFIVVLAAHVLVIGGMTTYYMLKGGSTDSDLASDKTSKSVKVAADGATVSDGQLPDAAAPADKSEMATTSTGTSDYTVPGAPGDTASTTPAPSTTTTPAPTPAPNPDAVTIPPAPAASEAVVVPSANEPTASMPSTPLQTGPVITPPATTAAPTPAPETASTAPADAAGTNALSQVPAQVGTYTVKAHDSLARIAHHHHLTVAKLKAANNLNSDMLRIGQKLVIPGDANASASLASLREPNTTLLGDTDTASMAKPDASAAAATPSVKAKPATKIAHAATTTSGGRHLYTVMKGDTLTKIARKFHTTASAIMASNDSLDARKLRIGQKLRIPSQESRSANIAPAPAVAQPAPAQQPQPIEPRATPTAQLANFLP